jgi:hypothetical protein
MTDDKAKNLDALIEKFLQRVEDILYQDNKYNDKNIAELIIRILEDEYDF